MKTRPVQMMDNIFLGLFSLGHTIELGIPAWILKDMVTRQTHPIDPKKLFGLSDDEGKDDTGSNIIAEYASKNGYPFSWGAVSEDIDVFDFGDGDETVGKFEFFPSYLLKSFPNSGMVEDLLMWMYQFHPQKNPLYPVDEATGDWFTLSFSASGEEKIECLRRWLAIVFIPKIFPDLVREATILIEEFKTKAILDSRDETENILIEHQRFQLCGDPARLSFFNRK